jgi:hypothetical protein
LYTSLVPHFATEDGKPLIDALCPRRAGNHLAVSVQQRAVCPKTHAST